MNSVDLREVVAVIDSARRRLRNSPKTSYTVGLDLIRAASKLNTIINISKR